MLTDWNCKVCQQPNSSSGQICVNCECPWDASIDEIERRVAGYVGPVFDEEHMENEAKGSMHDMFSDAWWDDELDNFDLSLVLIPLGFVLGFVVIVLATLSNSQPFSLGNALVVGLICGIGMFAGNLYRPLPLPSDLKTRRMVLVIYAIMFVGTILISALKEYR